jgi:hypothetical protein
MCAVPVHAELAAVANDVSATSGRAPHLHPPVSQAAYALGATSMNAAGLCYRLRGANCAMGRCCQRSPQKKFQKSDRL